MRAFVVRPFGIQEGVDFDVVHAELIAPALEMVGIEGDTTQEIARAGNIRQDMFELLATADLVIADISIHNANVFYELGVRHALRAKRTFLIRAELGNKRVFDLETDRYLPYDATSPKDALDALVAGLRDTLDSEEIDSPVMSLLQMNPGAVSSEISRLLEPPADFREEVFRAERERRVGDLALLSEEADLLGWGREGMRRVGNAQFALASWDPARDTWERVRRHEPNDIEANGRLATIYQKMKALTESDIAVERVLADTSVKGPERAELESLRASNIKTRWSAAWNALPAGAPRERAAIQSPLVKEAFEAYASAFADDRNHFYSGLNAVALLTVILELGDRFEDVWAATYVERDDEPDVQRRRYRKLREKLLGGVDLAMASAQRSLDFRRADDRWLEISRADYDFLSGAKSARVAASYLKALTGAQRFYLSAAHRQLQLYEALGVLPETTAAALAVIDELASALPTDVAASSGPERVLLFTGHRLDAPGRPSKRFPASAEDHARQLIAEAIDRECAATKGAVIGLSGGASGGDILFHELCGERGIATEMFIVCSREAYVTASVQDGGPDWVARFDKLAAKLPVRALGNSSDGIGQPRWLRPAKKYSVWQRSNRWMLNNALVYGADRTTLIALWNGVGGDGPGGTQDMVETARARGARVVVVDAKPLADL